MRLFIIYIFFLPFTIVKKMARNTKSEGQGYGPQGSRPKKLTFLEDGGGGGFG